MRSLRWADDRSGVRQVRGFVKDESESTQGETKVGRLRKGEAMTKKCVVCGKEYEPAPQNEKRQKVCTPVSHICKPSYEDLPSGKRKRIGCSGCCRDAYLQRVKDSDFDDAKLIDEESMKKILAAAKILDEDLYTMVRLTLALALRIGELRFLTRSRFKVDKGDHTVRVTALKQKGLPKYLEVIKATVYKIAMEYIKRHKLGDDDPLFPYTTRWYRMQWMKIQERAGIKEPWPFHSLRHTGLSDAGDECGGKIATVQRLGRHRSATSTQIYLHPEREDQRTLANRRKY